MGFEDPGEVGLIGKAAGEGDLYDRCIGLGKFSTGNVDSEMANVLAWCAAKMFAKDPGQMNRMNVNCFSDAGETNAVVEICFKHVPRPLQPTRAL